MNPVKVDHSDVDNEACTGDKVMHDIRASLAITRGFSKALEGSFNQLCDSVERVVSGDDARTDENVLKRISELEADCSFCLSRIERSLEQLGTRIEAGVRMPSNVRSEDSGAP